MTVLSTQGYAWYVSLDCMSTEELVHNRNWDEYEREMELEVYL